jgi:hypothetical protein
VNLSLSKPFLILTLAALALAAPAINAVPLTDWNNHLVGSYAPASGYTNDTEVTIAANKLITWYNGGANPNPDPAAVFSLTVGASVPPPALPGAAFEFKDETAPFDMVNTSTTAYVLRKYGNTAYLFFIGNVDPGSYAVPTNLFGEQNALSHLVAFTATTTTTVPDGGATMALLGACILVLEGLRRKFRRF